MSFHLIHFMFGCLGSPFTAASGLESDEPILSPHGLGFSYNSCAPNDAWALDVYIGLGPSECTIENPAWYYYENPPEVPFVKLRLHPRWPLSLTSGEAVSLVLRNNGDGRAFYYDESHPSSVTENRPYSVDGFATLEFDHGSEWSEGVEFGGFYWFTLSDGREFRGDFRGAHCGGERSCTD